MNYPDQNQIQQKSRQLSENFSNSIALIIISSLIFIASFLWKDFLTDLQSYLFPNSKNMLNRFLYTLALSSILILIAVLLKEWFQIQDQIRFDDTPLSNHNNIGDAFQSAIH